jgi:hypothetical protein
MSTIATLTIEMAANVARLQADMDQAKRVVGDSMKSIEQAVGLAKSAFIAFAGISSLDAFVGMIKGSLEASAKLHDLAAQTGATVEALSALGSIGKTSDTSLETISQAMNKLAKNMAGATEDTKGAGKALEAIGIDFTTFKSLSPEDQMKAVADAMGQFADGSGKSAVAMALYGKEGAKLIPFLKDLNEVSELQAKVTSEQAAMADNFTDNLTKLKASGEGWKKELSLGMLPALNDASQAVLEMTNGTGGLRETIRQLTADGTIQKWTNAAIVGLSYLLDAVQILIRAFNTLIIVLGSTLMATFYAVQGKFEAAGNALKTVGAEVADQWSDQTIGQKFRARLEEVKGLGQTSEEAKPKLDFTNVMNGNKEAADKQTKAYTDLVATIKEKIASTNLETESGGKLTEAQKQQLEINKLVEKGTISLKDATSDNTKALLAQLTAAEQAKAVQEDLRKISEEVWKEYLKSTDALQKNALAIEEKVRKQLEENDAIGKTKSELLQLEIARLKDEAATLAQIVQQEEYLGLCTRETIAHQDTLEALKKLIEAKEQGVHLQAAKEAADAWEKTAKTIETSLTDALMRGFESGKSFGANLRDTLFNMFKTLILRPIIQPIAQGASSAILGAVGMGASGTAAAATPGSLASMIGGATGFLGGGLKAGFTGIFGEAGTAGVYDAGMTAISAGNISGGVGTLAGGALGWLGAGAAGIGLGSLIAGDKSVGGLSGSSSSAIGTAIGAAVAGPLGAVLGGALGGLFNAAFGMGDKNVTASGVQGSVGGGAVTGQLFSNWHQDGGWFRSDRNGTDFAAITSDLQSAMNSGAQAILESTKAYADALGLPAEQLASVTTLFTAKLTGDAEKDKQAILDVLDQYQMALTNGFQETLAPFKKAGESLIETLQRLALIQGFSESINSLGGIFTTIANSSIAARESLIGMAGGIDALITKANAFVKDYYSQGEQAGLQARNIVDALKSVGIDGTNLASREDFRLLVETRDVNSQQGQEQLLKLLDLGPQFAQLSDYMKANDVTMKQLLDAAPQVEILNKMLTPTEQTAKSTGDLASTAKVGNTLLSDLNESVRAGTNSTTSAINVLAGAVNGMAAVAQAAVSAAQSAAASAAAASSAASSAADKVSLVQSQPTYIYDIGGAKP